MTTSADRTSIRQHGAGEWFIRGPLDTNYLSRVSHLPSYACLSIVLAAYFQLSLQADTAEDPSAVRLTRQLCETFNVSGKQKGKALDLLASAELIEIVERPQRRNPVIRLLDRYAV